jgi:hypothetical protein
MDGRHGIFSEISPSRQGGTSVLLGIISLALLIIWLVLVVLGKGGFVHLLLLNGIVIGVIDAVSMYRARMTES